MPPQDARSCVRFPTFQFPILWASSALLRQRPPASIPCHCVVCCAAVPQLLDHPALRRLVALAVGPSGDSVAAAAQGALLSFCIDECEGYLGGGVRDTLLPEVLDEWDSCGQGDDSLVGCHLCSMACRAHRLHGSLLSTLCSSCSVPCDREASSAAAAPFAPACRTRTCPPCSCRRHHRTCPPGGSA